MGFFTRSYSHLKEDQIIDKYLKQISAPNNFIVDIGASDGVKMSNTYHLFKRGNVGITIEGNVDKHQRLLSNYSMFPDVECFNQKVLPNNIVQILKSGNTPKDFLLMDLDIDSYDYFILEAVLQSFQPIMIITEINEALPPPVKFKVLPNEKFDWSGGHFFGYSIACLDDIMNRFEYSLVELHYNNAILISNNFWNDEVLTTTEAYLSGYKSRSNRRKKFYYNNDLEYLFDLSSPEIINELNIYFADYEGKYLLD